MSSLSCNIVQWPYYSVKQTAYVTIDFPHYSVSRRHGSTFVSPQVLKENIFLLSIIILPGNLTSVLLDNVLFTFERFAEGISNIMGKCRWWFHPLNQWQV